jgi:hypothetical protein
MTRALTVTLLVATAAAAAAGSSAAPAVGSSGAPPGATLSFRVFSHTNLPLSDVAWTGSQFLYATETIGRLAVSGPTGSPIAPLATIPQEVEEVRCVPSPGAHGFARGDVYCHAPRGTIWRIGADGSTHVFATLPETEQQDGTLAFDRHGGFGFAMLVSTGGSGSDGGNVYALDAAGSVRTIGAYPGPGGADGIELAPSRFGNAANDLLLAIDSTGNPSTYGAVLAMKPDGSVRRLVALPEGLNPIVAIGRDDAPRGKASAGLYLADTKSTNVFRAPAAQLRRYAGSVLVGTETTARLWIIQPSGSDFLAVPVRHNLSSGAIWNLEGGCWVG